MTHKVWTVLILVFVGTAASQAQSNSDLPREYLQDAVMAGPQELQDMQDWVQTAFTGETGTKESLPALELIRQDHNELRFGISCMKTPIIIGSQKFPHGLGTHANSEIRVHFPAGASRFQAWVGIDNNYDTGGVRGSVIFSVEMDGREAVRTGVLKGGDEPAEISLDIPQGVTQLTLKVDTTADGPAHDQSDWADAKLILENGNIIWLDELAGPSFSLTAEVPFSFRYDGKSSAELLPNWKQDVRTAKNKNYTERTITWLDPDSKLCVKAVAKSFANYPAVDWVIYFENQGDKNTRIIENIEALDLKIKTSKDQAIDLVKNTGDTLGPLSFNNIPVAIKAGQDLYRMTSHGGRPSSESFPFFRFSSEKENILCGIGWTGQWEVTAGRQQNSTQITAGQQITHLLLMPGEIIRTPRILLLSSRGDIDIAHNRFRRLMLFHYVPQQEGKPVQAPIVMQTFDRYVSRPGWATEEGQLLAVKYASEAGFCAWWLDAAWFPGGFPNGVGCEWYARPDDFPRGLKPVSDACHQAGMDFVLWFEPERVAGGTEIAKKYPQYVHGGENGGLFKLDDPQARRYLTDLLLKRIAEYGVDVYRNDFNIDPLNFWNQNDTPDRQGMTEIRYVEGLYAMWDELLAKNPGMLIDNCASGGRRIDLEMTMRSLPLWPSDTNCWAGNHQWSQNLTLGLSQYIPLYITCAWEPDIYVMRSCMKVGIVCQWAYLDKDFPWDQARKNLAEAKSCQKYWYGDFYPLTLAVDGAVDWCVYQNHRPDLNAGLVSAFRQTNCRYTGMAIPLKGLNAKSNYRITLVQEDFTRQQKTASGQELLDTGIEIYLPAKGSSALVLYEEIEQ